MRPNFLDISKTIGIWIVILGHYTWYFDIPFENNAVWNIAFLVTLFHMPLFFYISGLLNKNVDFKEGITKIWNRLIVPYILLNILTFVVGFVVNYFYTQSFTPKELLHFVMGILSGNSIGKNIYSGPLWFVFSLITIKLIFVFTENKISKYSKIIFLLSLLIGGGILYTNYKIPMRISSTFVGFIFFFLGYKTKEVMAYVEKRKNYELVIAGLTSLLLLYLCAKFNIHFDDKNGGLSINALRFGPHPMLFVVSGLAGIGLMFSISQLMLNLGIRNNLITIISKANIIILAFHQLIYFIFKGIITNHNVASALISSTVILAMCTLIYYLLSKYAPIFTGNR